MMDLLTEPGFIVLAVIGVFLTGISKSGFAGGAGVVAVPMLALVISPKVAVVLVLPLLLLMDFQTIAMHRKNLDFSEWRRIVPAALIGVGVGSVALGHLSDSLLQLIVGILSLGFALLQWLKLTQKVKADVPQNPTWLAASMGLIAGMTSSLIHAGGPPLNIYLASRKLPKAVWISTAAIFFASINASKVLSYAWIGLWQKDLLIISLLLLPVAIAGVRAGHSIAQRISEAAFVQAIMIFLALSGIGLISKGFGA